MCESRNSTSSPGPQETALPDSFLPTPYTVVIGRGKRVNEYAGNIRLKLLAHSFLAQYSDASCKIQKSNVVSEIVSMIRLACPVGAFVRLKNGCWFEVNEATAREKVGYTMRDLLHEKYRSSSKSKVARKKVARSNAQNLQAILSQESTPFVQLDQKNQFARQSEFASFNNPLSHDILDEGNLKLHPGNSFNPMHFSQPFRSSTDCAKLLHQLKSMPHPLPIIHQDGIYQRIENNRRLEEKNFFPDQTFPLLEENQAKGDFPGPRVDLSVSRRRSFTRNLERIGDSLFNLNHNSLIPLGMDDVTPDFLCEDFSADIFEE